jgi:hypothetical protein
MSKHIAHRHRHRRDVINRQQQTEDKITLVTCVKPLNRHMNLRSEIISHGGITEQHDQEHKLHHPNSILEIWLKDLSWLFPVCFQGGK